MLDLYKDLERAHQRYKGLLENAQSHGEEEYLQQSEEHVLEAMADLENAIDCQIKRNSQKGVAERLSEASKSLKVSTEKFRKESHAHESL